MKLIPLPSYDRTKKPILITDMDQTMIYSTRRITPTRDDVCVEVLKGRQFSYTSKKAYSDWEQLINEGRFIPITARSFKGYNRIKLPATPALAIVENGAAVLLNGVKDPYWEEYMLSLAKNTTNVSFKNTLQWLRGLKLSFPGGFTMGYVDGLYFSLKTKNAPQLVAILNSRFKDTGWVVYAHGVKTYLVPECVNKHTAASQWVCAPNVIAAGDSDMDEGLLGWAHRAFTPKTGALAGRDKPGPFWVIPPQSGTAFSQYVTSYSLSGNASV